MNSKKHFEQFVFSRRPKSTYFESLPRELYLELINYYKMIENPEYQYTYHDYGHMHGHNYSEIKCQRIDKNTSETIETDCIHSSDVKQSLIYDMLGWDTMFMPYNLGLWYDKKSNTLRQQSIKNYNPWNGYYEFDKITVWPVTCQLFDYLLLMLERMS